MTNVWVKRSWGEYSLGEPIAPARRYLSRRQQQSGYRLVRTGGGSIRRVHSDSVRFTKPNDRQGGRKKRPRSRRQDVLTMNQLYASRLAQRRKRYRVRYGYQSWSL